MCNGPNRARNRAPLFKRAPKAVVRRPGTLDPTFLESQSQQSYDVECIEHPVRSFSAKTDPKPDSLRARPLVVRSGLILFAQPAAAAGSRAAAERQARGLGTGTSDPLRRPEGDQGR
eukprot:scaffold42642_cov67-Phaeocystis_antarctica.AAC.3